MISVATTATVCSIESISRTALTPLLGANHSD